MKRLLSLLICAIAFLPSGAQNKIARISPGAPGWVTRGIEAAYKTGAKKAIIPAGTYVIEPSDGRNIELTNLRDFEIDATGVTFVFTDSTDASVVFEELSQHDTARPHRSASRTSVHAGNDRVDCRRWHVVRHSA